MGIYSDILLTVDYDRTLTGPDSTVPRRNLDAIRYFMDNGGAFTVNTGRSVPMARLFTEQVPVNAPLLLYNGVAAYDTKTGTFPILHPIALPQEPTLRRISELCRGLVLEVQGLTEHYAFDNNPDWDHLYNLIGCPHRFTTMDADMGPFLKMSVFAPMGSLGVRNLFQHNPELTALCDNCEAALRQEFGDSLCVLRASPRIIDLQTGGYHKGTAARELKAMLGRKTLVCIGDERNDIAMLDMADYPFCPGDSRLADRYPAVGSCGDGAVADVIYEKIPEILGKST